jgi:hypothetical protein
MPVRMVSAMVTSLLSGAVVHVGPWAGDQAHTCATEARVVRRQLGIIRCILTCLRSIVAGFLWRVEGGALVPFDGSPPRAIFLDVTAVESHAPPQSNILVLMGRL